MIFFFPGQIIMTTKKIYIYHKILNGQYTLSLDKILGHKTVGSVISVLQFVVVKEKGAKTLANE